MRLIFVVGVVGVLVLSAMLYSWYTGGEEGEDDDGTGPCGYYPSYKATIGVDETTEMVQVTLKNTKNCEMIWSAVAASLGGVHVSGEPVDDEGQIVTTSKKGESASWRISNVEGSYKVGGSYTIKVIEITNGILWQKDVIAIAQDIPAPEG